MPLDQATLRDTVRAARLVLEFTRGMDAAVPWTLIAGMRDQLIHAYDAVDLDEVWRTVHRDIPDLLTKIEPLIHF